MSIKTLRDLIIVVVVIARGITAFRWLTAPGVGAEQAQTIDSLRTVNAGLDASLKASAQSADSARRAVKLRLYRDSVNASRQLDSLEALIPDTATMIPRPIHEAIVASKDTTIANLWRAYRTADSGWVQAEDRLVAFQRQNAALLAQVNDLEGKARMGIIRRLKVAAPFVAGTFGACKLKLIAC